MARGFYALCLLLSFAAVADTILIATHVVRVTEGSAILLRALLCRGWVVIGVAIASALLILLRRRPSPRSNDAALRTFLGSSYMLRGICFSVAVSFLTIETGKLMNDAEMRRFFLQSGYAVWFLYFIMVAEILGAAGLFVARMIVPAASGLVIIMLGAIYTHYRNGDPLTDSLDAVHLLALLLCIILLDRAGRPDPQHA